ncbi:helix-turn-helix domain-containing protein [Arthrobacter sp. KK5.5]|uniref:helix-turn-helix domain-containing protein n=1 Tax=Arthrobacter sp. KK5.5 TaxID=3373084 RepID=UPI003EE52325
MSTVSNEMVNDFSTSHLPWRLNVRRDAVLEHKTVLLGGPWAVDCRLGGMTGRRDSREIERTDGEYVAVLLVRQGRETFTQSGRAAEIAPGYAALWDGVRPSECFSNGTLVKTTLFLPRDLCRDAVPQLETLVARPLPPSPSLRLLFDWLRTLKTMKGLDGDAAATAGRVAIDLLSSAIGASPGLTLDTRAIRLMEVKAFIDANLGDAQLTVDDIARANAVSTRYLHMLFQGSGETCRQYLMCRRRETANRLLQSSGPLSITEIAHRTGFDNPSSFSRAYRAAYGRSPREARGARS